MNAAPAPGPITRTAGGNAIDDKVTLRNDPRAQIWKIIEIEPGDLITLSDGGRRLIVVDESIKRSPKKASYRTPGAKYLFKTTCIHASAKDIDAMTEGAREISYEAFLRHVGRDAASTTFPNYDWSRRPRGLTLRADPIVTYHRSYYRDTPCIYVNHSRIFFVFTKS